MLIWAWNTNPFASGLVEWNLIFAHRCKLLFCKNLAAFQGKIRICFQRQVKEDCTQDLQSVLNIKYRHFKLHLVHIMFPIQTAWFHCLVICFTWLLMLNGVISSDNKELFFLPSIPEVSLQEQFKLASGISTLTFFDTCVAKVLSIVSLQCFRNLKSEF